MGSPSESPRDKADDDAAGLARELELERARPWWLKVAEAFWDESERHPFVTAGIRYGTVLVVVVYALRACFVK